tara:strand:- start:4268 stop:5257 length:990 start_codon:yes stop_codon:yes gene_type:complete
MNDLEKYLMTKEPTRVDKEQLMAMAKRAAARYIEDDVSLNDSITGMAKEASLTDEQVKRVVEYANNATFATLFKNNYDKNITFPMADTNAVLGGVQETKEKVSEVIVPSDSNGYIPGQEYVSLEEAFKTSDDFQKTASVDDTSKNKKQYLDLTQELHNLNHEKTVLSAALIDGLNSMKDMCKEASADGYAASTVGSVILSAGPSKGLVDVIQDYVGTDLVDFSSKTKLAMMGYSPVPGNPMTGLTQDLESVSNKLITSQQAITRTQMAMTELLAVLKGSEIGGPAARLFNPPGGAPMMDAPPPEGAPAGGMPPQKPAAAQLFSPKGPAQ